MISLVILGVLYILGVFCEFFSPYDPNKINNGYVYAPPQRIRFFHEGKFAGPFVYGYRLERDPATLRRIYVEDKAKVHRIKFFVRGDKYKF